MPFTLSLKPEGLAHSMGLNNEYENIHVAKTAHEKYGQGNHFCKNAYERLYIASVASIKV
jgi:hypothetical protein